MRLNDKTKPQYRQQLTLCLAALLIFGLTASSHAEEWDRERAHDRSTELEAFVKPARLYWRPYDLPGVRLAEYKLLSFDEVTGARTMLVRLPPGWKQAPGYHSADLEMFVVEGGVTMGDEAVGRYAYAYYPAGTSHSLSTEFGATVLQMWSAKPDYVAGAESRPGASTDEMIEGWRYGDAPTIGPSEFPEYREERFREDSPLRLKLIRNNQQTGEKTWIAIIPGGTPAMYGEGHLPRWASSESWEEGYMIAGDMTMAECLPQGEVAGRYTEGGYFFRPAGIRYGGPSLYSDSVAIWLYRSGPGHRVTYHDRCDEPQTVSNLKRAVR
tara:strand:- start:10534 stop:11511 length:978 start_codon:yes stop_codon:yes gene_type:complete